MKAKLSFHWLLVVLLCGMAASSIGVCMNCVGIFYTPVSDSLGVLRGSFALHATLSQLATSIIALAVPKLITRLRYKVLLICGTVVAVLSTVAMAYSRELWQFYILGLLRGASVGLFSSVPITIILTNWFHKSHGIATSITLSFSGLAGAVCSPLFTRCIDVWGWENTYLVMAAAAVIFTRQPCLCPLPSTPGIWGCVLMATMATLKPTARNLPNSVTKLLPFSACALWLCCTHPSPVSPSILRGLQ